VKRIYKLVVGKLLSFLGFGWTIPSEATPYDVETIRMVKKYTMTSPQRIWSLISSTRYIIDNEIEGDFCECGVWRGGSILAIARTLIDLGQTDRKIYLYDTFSGMTLPSDQDFEIGTGVSAAEVLHKASRSFGDHANSEASLEDVVNTLKLTDYPFENFIFVRGDVLNTLQNVKPDKLALLRLDTDWYESTKLELQVLYPILENQGILLIDDYGHWAGAKEAVDEYFAAKNYRPLLQAIDYTARLVIKHE